MNRTILATATAIALAGTAAAAPFTFRFDMPAFGFGELDGQTSILDVTVDNGGASPLSQSYLNTEITGLFVTVGSDSLGFSTPDDVLTSEGSQIYISTNSVGTPTLDLTAMTDSFAIFFVANTTAIQLGTSDGIGPSQYFAGLGADVGAIDQPFSVVGELVGDVPAPAIPLPAPALLLLTGLGALALARRT
ncbi:MAG: VPLPA-CTERM sorting domain-containing protein [Paracoccaceae bacterium]